MVDDQIGVLAGKGGWNPGKPTKFRKCSGIFAGTQYIFVVWVTLEFGCVGVDCTPKQPGSGESQTQKKYIHSENIPAQFLNFVFSPTGLGFRRDPVTLPCPRP